MKTNGGYIVENFKILETPIKHKNSESHIYEGLVKDVPMVCDVKKDLVVTWDKFGKCSNWSREDCFIEIPN